MGAVELILTVAAHIANCEKHPIRQIEPLFSIVRDVAEAWKVFDECANAVDGDPCVYQEEHVKGLHAACSRAASLLEDKC